MDNIISVQTFWRILLFFHFALAVALLAAVAIQAGAALMPARQRAGNFIDQFPAVPTRAFATAIVLIYVPQFLLGSWVYIKYRTYVRIPMEQLGHWWMVGGFDFKEHIISIGLALLPAFWYLWQQPSTEHPELRKSVTVLLALIVWCGFIAGHTANDFRGVGS
jgi:hypothetical protein